MKEVERHSVAVEHDALVRDNHQGVDIHNAAVGPGVAVERDAWAHGAVDLDASMRNNHQGVDHNVAVGPGYMKCEYV